MHKGNRLLFLSLLLVSFVFYANVQSDVVSSNQGDGWIVENAEQSTNSTGARPVTAQGSGFTVMAQSRAIRPFPLKKIEPAEKEPLLPGILKPYMAIQDRTDELPLKMTAPPLQKNFDGIKFHGFYPSDTTLAVGPAHVVVAVNSSYAIYTKTGAKRAQRTFEEWFSVLGETSNAFFFDPKLAYDQYSGHFIMVVDAVRDSDKRSWYILAVSQTTNPEGLWTFWALDMGLNGNTRTKNWADYPGVGLDEGAIYLTANMFNFSPGRFLHTKLRILKKSEVYQFGTVPWRDFWNLKDALGKLAFTVQPARSSGTTSAESMLSTNNVQGSSHTLWSVQNSTTSPVITKKKVSITGFQIAPYAKQKGGGSLIDSGDARLSDAVWMNGSIYAAHTVSHNWGSGAVAAIRFYQVRSSDGAVLQDGTLGADNAYYYFPAIATDLRGHTVIVFIRSGTGEFVSVRFTGRKATDPVSQLQSSAQIKSGTANYFLNPEAGVERWGDYSGISLDSDNSVWMYGMYAGLPTEDWKTRVAKTRFP